MTALAGWENFYVIVGSSAGALIAAHSPGQGGPPGPMAPPGRGGLMGAPPGREGPMGTSAAKPDKTRPVFPYPATARYTGTGSIDDAANFVAGPAQSVPAEALQWLGSGFYRPRYEAWCTAKGTVMTCQSSQRSK